MACRRCAATRRFDGRGQRGPAAVGKAEQADALRIDIGPRAQIGGGGKGVLGALAAAGIAAAAADILDAARREAVDDQRGIAPGRQPVRPDPRVAPSFRCSHA